MHRIPRIWVMVADRRLMRIFSKKGDSISLIAEIRPQRITPGTMPNQSTEKQPILALVDSETGEIRTHVVADVSGHTLRKVIAEHVDMANSDLQTDESTSYRQIGPEFRSHEKVNHSAGEYVRGNVTTNKLENYFSQLKRSIDGTHHHVSVEHLPRYLAEFDFRYSTCKMADAERLQMMVDRSAGRRLTYQPLKSARQRDAAG